MHGSTKYRKGMTKAFDEGHGAASASRYQAEVWGEVMDRLDELERACDERVRLLTEADATITSLRALLREVEWEGYDFGSPGEADPCCPVCREWATLDHAPDCRLAKELSDE